MALDRGIDLSRAQGAIETKEVSDETGNMWGGHRSSGKAPNRSVVESREDIETRSPDVNAGAEVREGSLCVGNGGGGNGNSLADTSGGGVDDIFVPVPGGNDNSDTRIKELEDERGLGWSNGLT